METSVTNEITEPKVDVVILSTSIWNDIKYSKDPVKEMLKNINTKEVKIIESFSEISQALKSLVTLNQKRDEEEKIKILQHMRGAARLFHLDFLPKNF